MSGVVRFDITDGERLEHWYLRIRRGDVAVSRMGPEADCVLSTDIATFDAILSGELNAMDAALHGALDVKGRVVLLTALQRLFPGPDEAADGRVEGNAGGPGERSATS